MEDTKNKKKVALVLSSGGARGLAQIGVIEELERLGFTITSIAGTSIGSLIGGLYATNKLQTFKEWIVDLDQLDIFRLVDFSLGSYGFIKGDRVFKEIRTFFKDVLIEDLPMPYAAVAADIHAGEEVVFRKGSLLKAIRASVAIPGIVQSRHYKGTELVDGGVLNPIPVDVVKRHDGDYLCVVNLNAKIPYEAPKTKSKQQQHNDNIYEKGIANFQKRWAKFFPDTAPKTPVIKNHKAKKLGYFESMMRSFDLVQDELCEQLIEKSQPDLLVEISRQACSTFDFHRGDELIAEGKKAFHKTLGWKMVRDSEFGCDFNNTIIE